MLFLDRFGPQYLPRQPSTLVSQHISFLKIFPSHNEIQNIFFMTLEERIIISDNIKQHKTYNEKLLNYSSQAENLKEK